MDEKRVGQYVELIHALLSCSGGEEENILNANRELVDMGLVEALLQESGFYLKCKLVANAERLTNLAQQIANFLHQVNSVNLEEMIDFCNQLFAAERENEQGVVFELLSQNLGFVTENLGKNLIEASRKLIAANSSELQADIVGLTGNIAIRLTEFPLGNPRGKIISAINCYQYVLSFYTDNPQGTARIQNNLGIAYSNLAAFSENPKQEIKLAISAYHNALQITKEAEFPQVYATTQNNLGAAYCGLAPFSENPKQEIEWAISSYHNALRVTTETELPQAYAETQNNLGNAYSDLAAFSESPKQEIENAIASYRNALRIMTEAELPQAYAETQNNLGNAYSDLAVFSENPKQEIERAISAYHNTLRIMTEAELPQVYATTQNNLGNAYSDLAAFSENPKQEIENAISSYRNALRVRTEVELPQAYAETQNNLGAAYYGLATFSENPKQGIENAIASYRNALRVRTEAELPQAYAETQNNLGAAYYGLATFSENPKQEIERAIASYRNALRVRTEVELPQAYAETQNNLGAAYCDLATLFENPKQKIENAISSYRNALRVRTEAELPQAYGTTQNNLGIAYSDLAPFSENPKQEIENAISSYRNALRVRTVDLRSTDCLQTARNLGNLGFRQGLWEIAIEGYSQAIEAVEYIRSWATNDDRRAEIHAQSIEIYTNVVQALINLEQYDKAIEYAERSRSQRIVDLLHSNDLYPQGNISETVKQKLAEFHAKQKAIDILQRQLDSKQNQSDRGQPNQRDLTEYQLDQLKQLQAEKQEIWNSLRSDDPILAGQVKVDPLPFAKMQELIKDKTDTAILYFYFTRNALLVFIVLSDQISLHQCPEQNIDNLNNFLFENWLKVYQTDSSLWRKQMPKILGEIAQRLNLNQLIQIHIPDRIQELIIVPHLYLHQIPFAALPISNSPRLAGEGQGVRAEYLSDRYRLRTISSLQILSYCHSRPVIANPTYATIENAQDNLPFAGFEGEQVAEMFQVPSDRRLIGKKAATTDNYRRLLESANSLLSAHHAGSRIDSPLDSKLQLGDGSISLGELMMSRYSDLSEIFLSCCETGLGAPQNLTDDILTLATGFLSAGARTVISSLWTVDDLATALFSMFYHQNIKAGSDRPTALYKAQSKLRKLQGTELNEGQPIRQKLDRYFDQQIQLLRNDPVKKNSQKIMEMEVIKLQIPQSAQQAFPFNHPFYWSSFIAQGES